MNSRPSTAFSTIGFSIAIGALLFVSRSSQAAVIVADSVADFSSTQGGDGFYYGYFTTFGDPASFTTAGMTFDGSFWEGPSVWPFTPGINYPFLGPTSQHPVSVNNPFSPGPADASAVRRYLASELIGPTLVTIAGTYGDGDIDGGDSQTVRIFVDGTLYLQDDLADDGGTIKNYAFDVLLSPTSIIDFEADPNAGGFQFDSTILTAQITREELAVVPEPSTLTLCTLALLGAVAAVKRRRCRSSTRPERYRISEASID